MRGREHIPREVIDAALAGFDGRAVTPRERARRIVRAALPSLRAWLCPDPIAHAMDAAGCKARATERPVRRPRRLTDMRLGTVFATPAEVARALANRAGR